MNIREAYILLNSDINKTLSRLMNENLVLKYSKKFIEDGSFTLLKESIDKKDYESAFRAAHTLKGVCLNMGYKDLIESSIALTEHLRGGNPLTDESLYKKVVEDYQKTIEVLKQLD